MPTVSENGRRRRKRTSMSVGRSRRRPTPHSRLYLVAQEIQRRPSLCAGSSPRRAYSRFLKWTLAGQDVTVEHELRLCARR